MSARKKAPRLEKTVIIAGDKFAAATLSSLYNGHGVYLPVLESARMGRPDAGAEIIRRNNAVARIKPDTVVLCGLAPQEVREYERRFRALDIVNINDVDSARNYRSGKTLGELVWSQRRIAAGLLLAKKSGKKLVVDPASEASADFVDNGAEHLVVCEDNDDVSQVIAANYAAAIGASLKIIDRPPREFVENVRDRLYSLYDGGDVQESQREIANKLASRISVEDQVNYKCVTYVTNGVPWGYSGSPQASCYLNIYPDLGLYLATALSEAIDDDRGVKTALLVDPGHVNSKEVSLALKMLRQRRVFCRVLDKQTATGHLVGNNIAYFPYDLLIISTHAGDIGGQRITYKFDDVKGKERRLVVDQAVAFSKVPGEDLFSVQQQDTFVSIDGVDWKDSDGKALIDTRSAMQAYMRLIDTDGLLDRVDSRTPVARIPNAMALALSDGAFIPMPQALAGSRPPLIINNSCNSWRRWAGHFIFAGALGYLGAVRSIMDIEAHEVVSEFLSKTDSSPIAFALFRAQSKVYSQNSRFPYVYYGTHFQRLHIIGLNDVSEVARELEKSLQDNRLFARDGKNRAAVEAVKFLERDVKEFRRKWNV